MEQPARQSKPLEPDDAMKDAEPPEDDDKDSIFYSDTDDND